MHERLRAQPAQLTGTVVIGPGAVTGLGARLFGWAVRPTSPAAYYFNIDVLAKAAEWYVNIKKND
jgi:hypothetical protein